MTITSIDGKKVYEVYNLAEATPDGIGIAADSPLDAVASAAFIFGGYASIEAAKADATFGKTSVCIGDYVTTTAV